MAVGRNETCPCGSGLKYKKCCAAAGERDDRAVLALRRAEKAAVEGLLEWARELYGLELLEMAWADFVGAEDLELPDEELPEYDSTFFPWLICNWVPRDWRIPDDAPADIPPLPKRPLALEYLDAVEVAPAVDRFLRAACAEPFSFFVVGAAVPGRSLTLRDILSGREVTVAERLGSTINPGAVIYTRVLSLDSVAIQFGCAPLVIPTSHHLRLIDLREKIAPGRLLEAAELLALDDELRAIYWAIVDEVFDPPLPELRNSEGDPLLVITLDYALDCTAEEALAALDDPADAVVDDLKRARNGRLRKARLSWLCAGGLLSPSHASGMSVSSVRLGAGVNGAADGRTIVAGLTITPGRLTVEVNSERREEAARAAIEARLGGRARLVGAEREDAAAALAARRHRLPSEEEDRARANSERFAALPEVQDRLRALIDAHYESWVDTPVPALDDQTPREAARTPVGRERVEVLLAHIADGKDPSTVPDIAALRRRLGLD